MRRPKPVAKFFTDYHIPGIHMMISDYSADGGVYKDFVTKTVPLLLEKRRLFIKLLKASIKHWNDPNRYDYVPPKPKKKRRWKRWRSRSRGGWWDLWYLRFLRESESVRFQQYKLNQREKVVVWQVLRFFSSYMGVRH